MANPNTTQNTAYSTDARYETPGGARQKANDVLIEAKQYSDEKLNVVQVIEQTVMSELETMGQTVMSEMAQISGQLQSANNKLSQVEAGIDEVKSGGIIPPNMVTFEPWTGGESVIIGNTPVDTTPPIVTASVASGSYTSAVSVILSSNEGGNIYYTLNGAEPTTSSTVYTSPILLSTTTTLKFFGRDAAGNSSAVQTKTYTITITPDAPDTTAPNNVTSLVTQSVTQTSLTLSWVASASPDVAGYEVYRGSTLLTTVTGTSYAVSSLAADTSYTFVVKAKDTTGNIASGVSVSVTTLAVETTPPVNEAWVTSGLLDKYDNVVKETKYTGKTGYFQGTDDFTICATVKPTAFYNILSQYNVGGQSTVRFFVSGALKPNVALWGSIQGTNGFPTLVADKTLVVGTYYHIVLIRQGGTLSIYVDNVFDKSLALNAAFTYNVSSEPITVGHNPSMDMPSVLYYNRALTAEELTQNYNALKK